MGTIYVPRLRYGEFPRRTDCTLASTTYWRGLSRKGLAGAAGLNPETVRRAERGGPVQGSTARALAATLGEEPSPALGRPVRGFWVRDSGAASDPSAFVAEIERLMAAKGTDGLEDLYGRFMGREPERIGGARWTFARFCRHAGADVEYVDSRFMVPLAEALGACDEDKYRLSYARAWGRSPVRA